MSQFNRRALRALLVAVACLAPAVGFAQLPVARLAHVFPPGGAQGSTVSVTVAGSDLDDPVRLRFSHPGIKGVPAGDGLKFNVTIASNVPPGVHEARFVGRFGISNPRAFVVGSAPETVSPTTNTTPGAAFEVAPGSTVNGRAAANAVSWFQFRAKSGQRIFLEALAESIDSRMDATLVLTDDAGGELARSRQGSPLDFTAPADGAWRVGVADFLYRGGPDYFFRLNLSTGPRLDYLFPPAGLPGVTTNFSVYGRNLPGGKVMKYQLLDGRPVEQIPVTLTIPGGGAAPLDTGLLVRPGDAALDGFEHRVTGPGGVSNPWLVGLATAPVTVELEPNSTATAAQAVTPPCEIAGQFFPAGDVDIYQFEAKKGDALWVEVISARLGLPTDPFVVVQRVTREAGGGEKTTDVLELYDNDTNVGDREFNTTSRDPSARFEAPETGLYRVTVRDLFGRNVASPRNVYRLALRRPAPDFRLVAMTLAPKYKADAKNIDIVVPLLRRGETVPVRVLAFRRDGFNGDIDLALENGPPGLIFEGDRIEAGKNSDTLLLTAAADAPAFAGPIRLVGRARVNDQEVVRPVRAGTLVFPVGNTDSERPESRVAREFCVGVMEQELAPITLAPATNRMWEVPAGGKLQVPLRVTRRGEFNAAFKLKPLGPGTPEALKEFEVAAGASNATLTLDFAALKLGPGTHAFTVQTTTTGKYRNNPEAAAAAEAESKEAGKQLTDAEAALKKAAGELELAIKTVSPAEDAAKAAATRLAEAKAALAQSPEDEKLKNAAATAEVNANETSARARAAVDARAAADKARTAAEAAVKEAKARKETAAARVKERNDKAKPKDVTITAYSQPFRVRVTAAEKADKPAKPAK